MKKLICLLLVVAVLAAVCFWAAAEAEYDAQGLKFSIDGKLVGCLRGALKYALYGGEPDSDHDGEAILIGYVGDPEEVNIPSTLTIAGYRPFHVIRVDDHAFEGCASLRRLTVGCSDDIYDRGFRDCFNLEYVDLGHIKNIQPGVFDGCQALKEFHFSDNMEDYSDYSIFKGMTKLETVHLSTKAWNIPKEFFRGCTSLKNVNCPTSAEFIGDYAFEGCAALEKLTLPEGLQDIRTYAFANCTALGEISIPQSVELIQEHAFDNTGITTLDLSRNRFFLRQTARTSVYAFANNENLETLYLCELAHENNLFEGAQYAFANCPRLKNVFFHRDTRVIPPYLFYNCDAIESLKFPASLEAIGSGAFMDCGKLSRVTFEGGRLHDLNYYSFGNCPELRFLCIPQDADIGRWRPDRDAFSGDRIVLALPRGEVDVYKFENVDMLMYVRYNENLSLFGDHEFPFTPYIVLDQPELVLPKAVATIQKSAFENTAAVSVAVPEGTRAIGARAFAGNGALRLAVIPASVTDIAGDAFSGSPNAVVYAPPGSAAARFADEHGLFLIPNT